MMDDYVINDEQPMRGTLIDVIRVIREYINRPIEPENTLIGKKTGTVVTADDAFPSVPRDVGVYGKSTQDGTPTPSAPVPINSVDALALYFCEDNLWRDHVEGYIGIYGDINSPNRVSQECTTDYFTVDNGDTIYTQNAMPSTEQPWVAFGVYDSNKAFISRKGFNVRTKDYTITASDAAYARVSMRTYGYPDYMAVARADETALITIPLSDHSIRSLPDGTRDELTLTYLGPSEEREGWGVFGAELVQRCDKTTVGACSWTSYSTTIYYSSLDGQTRKTAVGFLEFMSSYFAPETTVTLGSSTGKPANTIFGRNNEGQAVVRTETQYESAAAFKTANADATILYALATPVTHDLGTVELPILPAPNFTFFANGGSAQPDVQISYERDITIVIDKLEAEEAPVGALGVSRPITNTFEPTIQPQEETEWQSDSI